MRVGCEEGGDEGSGSIDGTTRAGREDKDGNFTYTILPHAQEQGDKGGVIYKDPMSVIVQGSGISLAEG